MCKLTLEDKIEILHKHLLGLSSQQEVADDMGVKTSTVAWLVRKAK